MEELHINDERSDTLSLSLSLPSFLTLLPLNDCVSWKQGKNSSLVMSNPVCLKAFHFLLWHEMNNEKEEKEEEDNPLTPFG